MAEPRTEQILTGTPASGDIAIGHILVLEADRVRGREPGSADDERALLKRACAVAEADLERLMAGEDELAGEILEFQVALLDDDDLTGPIFQLIADGTSADKAWTDSLDREIAEYRSSGDDYMSARAEDLLDLKRRVLRHIHEDDTGAQDTADDGILVADLLTPSMFLEQDWDKLAGAALLGGSPTSHVAILARARNINLVVGLEADLGSLHSGSVAVLDAEGGTLVSDPSAETLKRAQCRLAAAKADKASADAFMTKRAATADGEAVAVMINVDDPSLLDNHSPDICDGIGLTRTEFLFEGGSLPNEDRQYAVYRQILDWAGDRPVTIRTLDAGGDKPIPDVTIDGETNPFLGVRGIRLSLAKKELLRTQLRALARAAVHGHLKIMVPMVTVPRELAEVREMMAQVVGDLAAEGVPHTSPQIGMMVEVPAAALTAGSFDADFYSIGSNDLIQYTMAAARDNAAVANLAEATNPAVLELIARTVSAATARGVEVSLCGDMASEPELIGALLDSGLRTLSVAPAQVGRVKRAVNSYRNEASNGERN